MSNNKEMTVLNNYLMMYSALKLDDAEDSQEIKDLFDGTHRPVNIASGNELLLEALSVDLNTAETMDLQTPASETGYELTSFDKLDQIKLRNQCYIYKNALEKEIDELKHLSAVFESAVSNMKWEGDSAGKFKMICGDYCLVIMCLQMSKLFDVGDYDKLYNKLGSEYLAGDMILYGIESSKAGYDSECRARDHCNYMASNADDSETRSHYHSEACIHQALANNYYIEWQRYVGLKQEFEDIRAFSISFFTSGTAYRNNASKGMQLLATAFDETNGYTVPRDMDTWRRGVEGCHNKQMKRYTAKWRDLNGDWDMEKLGEEIRIDDDSVSDLDCVAMCYVIDDIYKQEDGLDKIATLMSSSYIGEFNAAETSSELCAKGYWTYRPSETYCRIVSTYGNRLNTTVLLNNNKCNDCTDEFQTYNLLRAGVVMSTVVPDADSSEDLGHLIQFDISLEEHNTDGYIGLNFNARKYEIGETAADIYTSNCRVYDYSGDISGIIDAYSDQYTEDIMKINTINEETKMIVTTAGGFIPGVGQYITVGSALASCIEISNDADAQSSACETMLYFDDVEDAFDEVNVSGSIIIKDNEIIVTAAVPGKDELSEYVDDYNNANNYGPNDEGYFEYNPNTFAEQYMTNEEYRAQFDLFATYVDKECKSHD